MSTPSEPATAGTPSGGTPGGGRTRAQTRRLQQASLGPALTRYRVMAIITGVLLVLVFTNLGVRGLTKVLGDEVHLAGSWLAVTHGWVYIVYLVTVVDMWSRLRWRAGRLVGLVLAGVLPGVSFVVERRVTREVHALLAELGQTSGSGTPADASGGRADA
ncbi:DUF3817 domain-containing protein [Pseudokineococcus sp. 1T1Z-3]|uniref:DUF3817 domain-containing protein n=1 Tax=Pseudokineococcus sp. 1T1Z-3 TaxID=3132745 RepID=UPI00309E20CB